MNKSVKTHGKRMTAMMLALVLVVSLFSTTAFAAQEDNYHDPAEHWLTASSRTNELDANAVVTHETFHCAVCQKPTSFTAWRTPEYTRDGVTALSRNVLYSDGTLVGGEGTGRILDGTPGVDAYYTGYHWTKAMCDTCGTMNSNGGLTGYSFNKNVYNLYDCAAEFMEKLPENVTYDMADSTYHTKTVKGGEYCCFCFGTRYKDTSTLERHTIKKTVIPQISNGRFAIVENCEKCSYEKISYVAAKSVVADYYGVVDGQPHTLTVSDLSDAGVSTQIRYGNSAESCTLASAPNYTTEGQYTVYYQVSYTYGGESMTENGVAYVWLRNEASDKGCACGCGDPDCDCTGKNCDGSCNKGCGGDNGSGGQHNFTLLDTVNPTCKTLGYTRYLCVGCGVIEKRDYVNNLDHAWQSIVIREANCEAGGKVLNICKNCGEVQEKTTLKGEHEYFTFTVEATCTNPGYTVKECEICGDRHINDMTSALPHNYEAHVIPATCDNGGKTVHLCEGCGSSFVTDYTTALGHKFDNGTTVTTPSCNGEGVTEFRCERCGYHYLEGNSATGHTPDHEATCTEPSTCTSCGAVLKPAIGHKASDWIIDQQPTTEKEGAQHKECVNCGKVLETGKLDKIYMSATTDSHGEAIVGGYLVIVTDTDTKNPVSNAAVVLNENGSIAIRLPNNRLIDYADQTTVQVKLVKDDSPVSNLVIAVTDKNSNYAAGVTDKAGQITVPGTSGKTNGDGNATVGYEDEDGNRFTITVKVEDYETGRPIEDATVTIGKTGNITVVLPDGTEMDKDNRITITVTDNRKKPLEDENVIVKGDLGQKAEGKTDEDGKLTVPAVVQTERHTAYIVGFPDGTFGPEKNMTRSEAAAIFARLLAAKNGEALQEYGSYKTKFSDVPATAWYASSVKYLTYYGVVFGCGDDIFAPERPITRAEFTVMAVRFFDVYGGGAEEIMEKYTEFTDVSDGYWAAEYIKDAAIHGWVFGYGDGTFGAEKSITRAEVVSLVNRLLGWEADKNFVNKNLRKLNTFSDMTDKKHWAYYAVMEAANTHTATFDDDESWSK
ncbi:MAG: S-layer homology domain-containing protein [Muribaculaceae bacterium]|nr:S-layer homology domain-containing protein [Muribaculaceae bacterium]